MRSPEHAAVGLAVSLAGAATLGTVGSYGPATLAALVVCGLLLSVFVDLDHFVIERYRTGSWGALRRCLGNPIGAFTAQGEGWIFEDGAALERPRLVSHLLIGTGLVAALVAVDPAVAAFVGVVLLAHVGCDVLRDAGIA